jgi:ABC-2 type transport system permease protein
MEAVRQPVLGTPRYGLRHTLRILRVMASTEFKLKYAGSSLGYVWTVIKPLVLFSVMYEVFSHIVKLTGFPHFGVYLLVGVVLWTFFIDATQMAMPSIVVRGSLLRKLSFPRLTVPISVTLTSVFSFAANLFVIIAFVVAARLTPRLDWLALLPLLIELYLFIVAVSVILATLFVRFRDVGQVWELGSQVLFYGSAVMYPIQFLPTWGQGIALLFPFTQVMQDIRVILIQPSSTFPPFDPYYFGSLGRLIPIALTLLLLVFALWLFRRESPRFAELV